MNFKLIFSALLMLVISACSHLGTVASKQRTPDNLCGIFAQFKGWQSSAIASEKKWQIDQSISMAFINHESGFNAKAKPPRKRTLGIFPGQHLSSAYGYPQAINGTWAMYKKLTGYTSADRTDFNDAIDFVGWYNARSVRLNNIQANDTYNLYLAYHEGHGGFANKSYLAKPWLLNVAQDVAHQAERYQRQLEYCSPI